MGRLAPIEAASFFRIVTSSYFDKLNKHPQSTIAKKDRADSGTSRVQEVQQLLLKSKAQKKGV